MNATTTVQIPHYSVLVVGGGQAGLSMSYYLQQAGIDHLVFEKSTAMHVWSDRRWDSFCLVTPNWQCNLPGHPYAGNDPHGFMKKNEIVEYLAAFKAKVAAPIHEGVTVQKVTARPQGGFDVSTSEGRYTTDQVVVASGGYHTPVIPRLAERLPASVMQVHSEQYRNADALPEGAVLVVGSGQSGAQIAEDLHLAGRKVFLAVGGAPRCARFYRGKDVVDWLADMNYYDMPVDLHPLREGVRDNTNHYVTGRDGGRDIDLRRFANEGMELYGTLDGLEGESLRFKPDLTANLDGADKVYNGINASIDKWIEKNGIDALPGGAYEPLWTPTGERTSLSLAEAGVSAIVWCIGFHPDFAWLDLPVFNGRGQAGHVRGVSRYPGIYFLGLPWLYTWGSGRFSGVSRDAAHLASCIERYASSLVTSLQAGSEVTEPERSAA
ncbi:MSMEG_0569 family flavin-dependent oxidoreductase [soil metagenome]